MKIFIVKKRSGKSYHSTLEAALAKFTHLDGWVVTGGTTSIDGFTSELFYLRRGEYGVVKTVTLED